MFGTTATADEGLGTTDIKVATSWHSGAVGAGGKIEIINPSNTSATSRTSIYTTVTYTDTANAHFRMNMCHGFYDSNSAITNLRILFSSGDIATGNFRLYGVV